MITGFNTDVSHDGRVFHVQTEDKGLKNPVVESLIYSGGEIITARRSSYEELVTSSGYSEEALLRRMESQHNDLVREIQAGRFDTDVPKPFGYNLVSNRSLDEVVLEFLKNELPQQLKLDVVETQALLGGTRPTLKLKVWGGATDEPVAGATVTVKLASGSRKALELFSGTTDPEGLLEASFAIPDAAKGAQLVCLAEANGLRAELKQPVSPGQRQSSKTA